MLRRVCLALAGLSASFGWVGLLHAQDTRRVSEPSVPPACAVLEARLAAPAGVLSEESERSPDTARIQGAIDGCAPGQAVVLARTGEKDVFLTGPLRLRPGVALVVAERTALFASRNPRDYDVEPGSCGVLRPVDRRGPGCRPLLLAEDAPGSAVMGPGAIDGRGGAKMAGDDRSWWELAKQAKVLDLQQSCPRLLDRPPLERLRPLPGHAPQLPQLPRGRRADGRLHGLGRQDQDAEDRAQHGRDRSLLLHERHDRPQLHRHGRRQRGDQVGPGRQGRADHDRAQPLLLRPRDVDRQRDERRRQRRARRRPDDRRRRQRAAHQVRPQPGRAGRGRRLRGRLPARRGEPDRAHDHVHDVPRRPPARLPQDPAHGRAQRDARLVHASSACPSTGSASRSTT